MISIIKNTGLSLCLAGIMSSAFAVAPDFVEKLAADSRPMEDKIRDGARHPVQVIELLDVEAGMTVVDIGAAGGWWTRVLAAAVGENGTVISQAPGGRSGETPADIAAMNNVQVISQLSEVAANSADVAITALNIHHNNAERSAAYFQQIYTMMKPGGVVAVIDHIGDPSIDNSQLHRIPIDVVRGWLEASDFEILEESNLLRNNADDHTHPSGGFEPILGRNSDRFLFVIRKPAM
tara:strand:+ start:2453 stop:3160 length:708 start_codon:yes stop_codon:yes gene_type:complete